MDVRADGLLHAVRTAPARDRVPPGRAVRRAAVARRSVARREHQRHGHAQRAGVRGEGRRPKVIVYAASGGTIYGEPKRIPAKESTAQGSHPTSPYGISKKVGARLPRLLPAVPRPGLHGARARQRLRAAPGPARRGRRDRDLRREDAGGGDATIFGDGNQTRDYVFIDDMVHAFVQAMERGVGQAGQHRHRPGDEREPPLPAARRHHRLHRTSPATGRSRPASSGGSRSTSRARPARSAGSRGPTSRTASPRRSRS